MREEDVAMLVMDVDGVLTDGKIIWIPMPDGSLSEAKAFDVTDGAGIVMARRAGIRTAVISSRSSPAVKRRAEELSIEFVYAGVADKREALLDLAARAGIAPDRICYVGDDLPDLRPMMRAGFPVAVANARPEVRARAAYITRASGGNGAIREIVELILKAQRKWDSIVEEEISGHIP